MNQPVPILNYSLFYVGYKPPENPIELLDGYDLEDVILTIVGLRNSMDKSNYDYKKDGGIAAIMGCLPPERAARLKAFLYRKQGFALVNPAVIDRILVDLFRRWSTAEVTKEITGGGEFEQRILDVLLAYNEIHYNNDIADDMVYSHGLIWKLAMMQGVSGVDKIVFARRGPIKHLVMLDFLRRSLGEKYALLQKSLEEQAGLSNIHEFIGNFLYFFSYAENKKGQEGLLPRISKKDQVNAYIGPMGMVMDKNVASDERFDIGMLLARPFFETSKGVFVLLDHRNFSLLVERVFMYLLYHKSDFLKLAGIRNINGLFAHFGKHYYEGFLVAKLLSYLQRPGVRVLPSDDIFLADFTLVVNETDVFVIEVKSVVLHYEVFNTQDVEAFRSHIQEKYISDSGTSQLQRFIGYLREDRHKLLGIQNPAKKLNIFPVIVFTDPQAATYGVNDFVGQTANPLFAQFRSDFNRVMPLTMISSDFFVENVELLKRDRNLLKKLIREYHFFIQRSMKAYEKNRTVQNYAISMVGFDRFAIGKYGAYRVPQGEIFLSLGEVFGLKYPDPNDLSSESGHQSEQ